MSIENHPNINAVGLLLDIVTAIERHHRGNARIEGLDMKMFENDIGNFVVQVSNKLDDKYGVPGRVIVQEDE